jgi:hypothetical protein
MELDQPHLQWIFNVIAITAVTSLGTICYLLKRDKDELLAGELNPRREPDQHHSKDLAPPPPVPASKHSAPEQHATAQKESPTPPAPGSPPTPQAPPARDTGIRQFVTQRSQGWVAPSPSQWKKRSRNAAAPALGWRPVFTQPGKAA